jgi:hypothetical protein
MLASTILSALLVTSPALAVTPPHGSSLLNHPDRAYRLGLTAEIGTVKALAHRIQFSENGTMFDYVEDGGQDILFPFTRIAADLDIGERHSVVLLYQPLTLQSEIQLQDDLVVDNGTFGAGEALDLQYGFDFYRVSWLYDLQADPARELGLGLSLQLRNADIQFTSADGTLRRVNRDLGPVPILKLRTRQPLKGATWWGLEVDGFYAPIKYINGSNTDVVGAIADASLRVGAPLEHGGEAFLNLRYVGGGAEGTSQRYDGPGDGYVENWVHFVALSLGLSLR